MASSFIILTIVGPGTIGTVREKSVLSQATVISACRESHSEATSPKLRPFVKLLQSGFL